MTKVNYNKHLIVIFHGGGGRRSYNDLKREWMNSPQNFCYLNISSLAVVVVVVVMNVKLDFEMVYFFKRTLLALYL